MTLHAYELYDAAALAYSRAHALDPLKFDWDYLLGAADLARGQFDLAAASFERALLVRPSDLVTRLRLADSLATLAKWDEAAVHYGRILDEHPDCPQAWYGLGRVQAAKGDHAAAIKSYATACKLFPAYGVAQFALAGELRAAGRKAEAAEHLVAYSQNVTREPPLEDPLFQRIHDLNNGVQAHLSRAVELQKAGMLEEAIRENEAALKADAGAVQAHINLVPLYARTGNAAQARQHCDAAIAQAPGRSDAWYNLGVLLFDAKDYRGAEDAYRHALAIDPDYAEAHNNLGVIYEQQGRLDKAEKEFRNAVAGRPDYPLARFHLGRILVNRQEYGEAIQHFQRALEPEGEQTPAYLYALGATYERAGDRPRALEYLRRARDAASARNQQQLINSIDRDLRVLQNEQ